MPYSPDIYNPPPETSTIIDLTPTDQDPSEMPKPDSPNFAEYILSSGEPYNLLRNFNIIEDTTLVEKEAVLFYHGENYPIPIETGAVLANAQTPGKPH